MLGSLAEGVGECNRPRAPLALGVPQETSDDTIVLRALERAGAVDDAASHPNHFECRGEHRELALRELTGVETLTIKTDGVPYTITVKDKDGKDVEREVKPKQHLYLNVPNGAVASPWVGHPLENTESLNNDLDYNWESLAWVRMPRRRSPGKDIVLIRFDVAEPVLHLLNTEGRPANECLVGYILVGHKIAYVALVDLVGIPTRELDALSKKPE